MSVLTWNILVQFVICILVQMKEISNAQLKLIPNRAVRYSRDAFSLHRPNSQVQYTSSSNMEPTNAYICKDDDAESIHFSLECDKQFSCKLTTTLITSQVVERFTDLDSLTDHCQQPFNPLLLHKFGRVAYSRMEPFIVSQDQILELNLWFTNFTRLPPNYFCGLSSLTKLTMVNNTFKSSTDLGFSSQCANQKCCICNLQSLQLLKNKMEILNASSFCSFPNLTYLDLSQNAISEIDNMAFEGLENLLNLNISQNALIRLPENGFRPLQKLIILNLSSNLLDETDFKSFRHLSNLKVLVLASNKISRITGSLFEGLLSLKELHLNKNYLFYLGQDFSILNSLVVLDLSENMLSNIPPSIFEKIENLSILNLRQNNLSLLTHLNFNIDTEMVSLDVSHNRLTTLPVLNGLKKVKFIDFSNNLIQEITNRDRIILCNITMIEYLMLNTNRIEDIAVDAFHCKNPSSSITNLSLNSNKIKTISGAFKNSDLKTLSLKNNSIIELSLEDISHNIIELDISFNEIKLFYGICQEGQCSNASKALKKLNLSYNRISKVLAIHLPINLQLLNLKHNDLTSFSFPETFFNNTVQVKVPKNLKVVDLSINKLRLACPFIFYTTNYHDMPTFKLANNPLICSCEAEFLNVAVADSSQNDSLKSLSKELPNVLKNSNQHSDMLDTSKLKCSDRFSCSTKYATARCTCQCNVHGIYNSVCKFPCPSQCQCYLNSRYNSHFINCTYRNLSHIPGKMTSRIQIDLDFSHNNMEVIGPSSLATYGSSKTLFFQHNQIREIHPAAFIHVPDVIVLNLSCNNLSYLPPGVFQYQLKLSELYLSCNKLSFIASPTIQISGSLRVLTLHNNKLTNFSVWNLLNHTPPTWFRLTLRNNSWSCECQYVNQFRAWLQNYSYIVNDSSQVFCLMMDGSTAQIPMISFNSSHCYTFPESLAVFPNTTQWYLILAALLFLVLVGAAVFTFRKEFQVIVYSRFGVRLFSQLANDEQTMPYDAFIAYSSLDEVFVMQTFIPGLEQIEKPYRVCIHQRDFLAGAMLTESIVEAIGKSLRTIIILSKHFVSSNWCRFEFRSAHMKMLSDRCSRVIVIILDSVPKDLDSEMKLYVNTNTYLNWNDLLFWKKLYFVMPDRRPSSDQSHQEHSIDTRL